MIQPRWDLLFDALAVSREIVMHGQSDDRWRALQRAFARLDEEAPNNRTLLEIEHFPIYRITSSIALERLRQVIDEGHTRERDDGYTYGELAHAGATYAMHSATFLGASMRNTTYLTRRAPPWWPWGPRRWKPKSPREDLIRAAALIVAEIERLDRAERAADAAVGEPE